MIQEEERTISPDQFNGEIVFEDTLRPQRLMDYVGQQTIKNNLEILIQAAKKRGDALDHILLYGPPGLGKTTLAHIIANEMGKQVHVTSGPAIERAGDLAAILTNLQEGDILFIDEIHRLHRIVEEMLYPAMEDQAIDIIIGKGPSAKTLRLDLPKLTIIGATTKLSSLSSPLRDRFGVTYHFNFYEYEDIKQIVHRSSKILQIPIQEDGAQEIAKRSRRTPRVANRLLKRVRDYAQVKGDGIITNEIAKAALLMLNVDEFGLDAIDRRILHLIIEKYQGGPVGVSTIAAATSEEIQTIEDVYEPFLMQMGFLNRTNRGRMATKQAYEHLGISYSDKQQPLV